MAEFKVINETPLVIDSEKHRIWLLDKVIETNHETFKSIKITYDAEKDIDYLILNPGRGEEVINLGKGKLPPRVFDSGD